MYITTQKKTLQSVHKLIELTSLKYMYRKKVPTVKYVTCCNCKSVLLETLGCNFLCHNCINCCDRYSKDTFDRIGHCNTLKPPIVRLNETTTTSTFSTYCIGHWKQRIKRCRRCESENVSVFADNWAYCSEHLPEERTYHYNVISALKAKGDLPYELCLKIVKQTLEP